MKKLVLLGLLLFVGVTLTAQSKNAKATIEVDGVCLMCKDRIEKACIKTKGVKSAVWDVNSHELSLIYNEQKTDLTAIQESIAAVGHDTQETFVRKHVHWIEFAIARRRWTKQM